MPPQDSNLHTSDCESDAFTRRPEGSYSGEIIFGLICLYGLILQTHLLFFLLSLHCFEGISKFEILASLTSCSYLNRSIGDRPIQKQKQNKKLKVMVGLGLRLGLGLELGLGLGFIIDSLIWYCFIRDLLITYWLEKILIE